MLNYVRKHRQLAYLVSAIIVMLAVFFTAYFIRIKARQISYMSAVSWLQVAILEELNSFYVKHGKYPRTLRDLNIPFPGDNATPDMLKLFTYTPDVNSFKLVLQTNAEKGYCYEYVGRSGKLVRFNEYVRHKLVKSTDFNDLGIYEMKF